DVEDLSLERQDRLELPVAALLGRAAGGIALDEVELAEGGVALLAVRELAGKAHAVEDAFPARELARLPRGLAGAGRLHDLRADDAGVRGTLEEEVRELLRDHL